MLLAANMASFKQCKYARPQSISKVSTRLYVVIFIQMFGYQVSRTASYLFAAYIIQQRLNSGSIKIRRDAAAVYVT